jgi:tetratricopeptide (TPR) repeat protein
MTRLRFLILAGAVGLLLANPTRAQDLQASLSAFDMGTAFIEDGHYTEALSAFDQALESGFENAALHYNRGIAYYRLDRIGPAIASFERARRLEPDDRTIAHNLSIARLKTKDRMSRMPPPIGASVWQFLAFRLGPTTLFVLGLLAYLVWCALAALRVRHRAWRRRGLWVAGVMAVAGLGLGLLASVRPAFGPAAVVVEDEVSVFPSAAATEATDLNIHEGLTVTVVGHSGDWTAVRLPNGVTGWVASEGLLDI